jgi:Divergent InlB B-repeat domain
LPKSGRPVPSVLFRALPALTALCAAFAIFAPSASAAPWGPPEGISVPGGSASWSQVGIDAGGEATAIWTRSDGLHLEAQAATRPVGGSWGPPVDLSGSAGNAENPTLAVDPAGDVVAAWKERLAGSEAIEINYRPAGGAWQGPVAVEFGSAVVETPAVAIDEAGDAVVIWRQGVGGNHVIFAASISAGGAPSPPVAISSSALNAEAPDLAMGRSGTAVAVWQSSSGATSVVESSILPLGGSWAGPEAVSAPATVTEPPQVVADDGGGFAAIWSRSSIGLVAEVASMPAGGGWSAPEAISTLGLEAHAPQLAVDSAGDAVAAWYRFDGSVGSVEGTNRVAGGPWTSPVRHSPIGAEAEAPQLAISPFGVAQVVWSGWNEATHNYVLRGDQQRLDGSWKPSITISLEGEEAYGPHLAVDASGDAVVVWNGEVPLGSEIRSSFRAGGTPLVITKSGSGAGTVTSQPAAIDCGTTCSVRLPEESSVTLIASPAAGSRFVGWSGACAGSADCTVEIGAAQTSVAAEFEATATATGEGGTESGAEGATNPTLPAAATNCSVAGPVSVGTFAPTPKPGSVVAGVRARIGVDGPSSVSVAGTLTFGAGKARGIDLGTVAFRASGPHNLRFALPAAVRSQLPLGSSVWVSFAVTAKADAQKDCATPGATTKKLKLKVVKVLSAAAPA